jgi:glycosyltransferase involved in cell wall biosynthesis
VKKAIVITPTTGAPVLRDAILSVKNQDYENLEHLVVIDGEKFLENANIILKEFKKIKIATVPFNTGGEGFYGHRIMAAFSHLVPHDYILFLDQDNWYEFNHVSSLIKEIEEYNFEWAYSLRNIYDENKNFICKDDCESLGRWPVWVKNDQHLVDSSSYCFTNKFLRMVGHIWDYGWGADRRFYTIIKNEMNHKNYGCSSRYTLNYRLGGNEGSVKPEFFIKGNEIMRTKYKKFPWNNILM